MSPPRDDAIADLRDLTEAAARLRNDLRATEGVYRRTTRTLERGTSVAKAMQMVKADQVRLGLTESIEDFEYIRHRARLSLTASGLDEGMTIGQIGRAWGISRQLAARYAREARDPA
jgi:hypothetical protein